jgi:anti-sigma factor (TIGR02949 family)
MEGLVRAAGCRTGTGTIGATVRSRSNRTQCRHTRRVLQGYLDGEVDATTAWDVSRHLSGCEDCFRDADVLRTLKDVLSRLHEPPDPNVHERLLRIAAMLADPTARS